MPGSCRASARGGLSSSTTSPTAPSWRQASAPRYCRCCRRWGWCRPERRRPPDRAEGRARAAAGLAEGADPGERLVVLGGADVVAQAGELGLLNGDPQRAEGFGEAVRALHAGGAQERTPLRGHRRGIVVFGAHRDPEGHASDGIQVDVVAKPSRQVGNAERELERLRPAVHVALRQRQGVRTGGHHHPPLHPLRLERAKRSASWAPREKPYRTTWD